MENNFDRINKETQNIGSIAPKSNSNESKIFKNGKTKITLKHPIYKNDKKNQDKDKKESNKKTYSTVRITTNTSLKLHSLLTASGYPNRDKLIQDMIHFAKPILLNNSSKSNKYKKTYKLLKDFRAKAKKVRNL